ncbi:MAG TPA: chromate efflux transporter [Xanthobacteraceae bacterium]
MSGNAAEVGGAFLKLGLASFGGPIAHLGYFRREFVERRHWLDEEHFGQLVGLCQFLPGPASSQLGFAIGLMRAGWLGAVAAFVGFTLPSALLLYALAVSTDYLAGSWAQAAVHGLKLVAVAVVGQAVFGMARSLAPDPPRALLAAVAGGLMAVTANPWMQFVAIAVGAALGPWLCRHPISSPAGDIAVGYGRRLGALLLAAFGILLLMALLLAPRGSPLAQVGGAFYRTGALVFGGGHVVLPLLQHAVVDPGWTDNSTFLSGYGAAQAVPGPMFSVAIFLGERLSGEHGGASGALVAVLGIFLPGLLLVAGVLPFWESLRARDVSARILAGVNAVVVGLLAAALYDPVWTSAIRDGKDFAIALMAFALLVGARWPSWAAVLGCVVASLLRA